MNEEPQATPAEKDQGQESAQGPQGEGGLQVSPEDIASLTALGGSQFAHDIVEMYKTSGDPEALKKKAVAASSDDRQKRGQLHHEVRRIFNSKIETSTDDSGAVVATLAARRGGRQRGGRGGGGGRNRQREEKPAGDYVHFTLYKDNRDTLDAVNQVARMLRVKPQSIGYSGTKDRRASTVQRCSVRYIRPRNLAGINGKLRGVVTGDYEYAQEPIRLGQLQGNEFVITLKNCKLLGEANSKPLEERVEILRQNAQSAMDHLSDHGWINYFGHQRFGTHEIGTHEVGKLILGEKYEDAVKAILHYDPEIAEKGEKGDLPQELSFRDEILRHQACMLFVTDKDHARAEEIIPRRFGAESSILRHLNRAGAQSRKDFVGALIHITRGLRSMYLHAYQSYVWNNVASRRWELHGEKVIKGDLILVEASDTTNAEPEQDQDGDEVINPNDEEGFAKVHARALTEEEASSGQYTIRDIVLPTPGYEVIYPDNDIGAFYAEFMARPENGGLDPDKMRRIRREFSLPGRYRRLMNRFLGTPSVEVKTYVDDTEQMHPTDLDLIRAAGSGKGKRARESSGAAGDEPAGKKFKGDGDENGSVVEKDEAEAAPSKEPEEKKTVGEAEKKIAAVVRFQLGSSAYATVTLRELMGDPPESNTSE